MAEVFDRAEADEFTGRGRIAETESGGVIGEKILVSLYRVEFERTRQPGPPQKKPGPLPGARPYSFVVLPVRT